MAPERPLFEVFHLAVGDLDAFGVLAWVELGGDGIPAPPASRLRSVSQATGEENGIYPNGQVLRRA